MIAQSEESAERRDGRAEEWRVNTSVVLQEIKDMQTAINSRLANVEGELAANRGAARMGMAMLTVFGGGAAVALTYLLNHLQWRP